MPAAPAPLQTSLVSSILRPVRSSELSRPAAEMIAVDSGLGYLVIDARNSGKRYDLVVAAMLMIGVIGLGLDIGFRRLETIRSVRWGFRNE